MQEALLAATLQWPKEGLPDNPRGWLIQVAARRVTDQLRSESARRRRETVAATDPPSLASSGSSFGVASPLSEYSIGSIFGTAGSTRQAEQDDTLVLLCMCCHPSLTSSSAVALTLRAVGGLTTAEIARAFLVPESTMAQRISRAKQTIKSSGVPFSMPTRDERAERLTVFLHVLYLIFNEGYTSSFSKSLQRTELSIEAIRLGRALHQLLADESEVAGLLALMLLTDARRPARTGSDGELIPLDKQDRSLWDQSAITEGVALISATLAKGAVGPYQLQAAIAAVPRTKDVRRHRLAADPGAVWVTETDVRQPDGGAQSRHRGRHGARSTRRTRSVEGSRRRRATCWSLSHRCRACPSARASGRPGRRRRALSRGRRSHDEHS